MRIDDRAHRSGVGETYVVKEATAQKRVGQLLFVIRGDDDDRALRCADDFARLVDVELHAIEFEKKIVRKFDVRLVDFIDQKNRSLAMRESVPKLAGFDVVANV